MSRVRAILSVLALLGVLALAAIEAPGPANVSFAELERFRTEGVPDARWPALMETLGTEEQSASVRAFVRDMKPFPAAKLVALLTHPRLAARLGALELLEDAAGETFEFDPWQDNAGDAANQEALQRWKQWAEKGDIKPIERTGKLTDETFRVLAQEITGGKPDRAERALRRIEAYGLAAIAPIERFLQAQPGLDGLPRAMLKQAQYRVLIAQTLPRQAASLARDLSVGLPEAQSTALGGLSGAGVTVLPIISEFLHSNDPLVRESAADAAFAAAGKEAVPLVVELIGSEKAESVLHAMLRGLGKLASEAAEMEDEAEPQAARPTGLAALFSSAKAKPPADLKDPKDPTTAILKLLEHPSENVVVSAIEALGFTRTGNPAPALEKMLADARWRVRAAALETIGKRSLRGSVEAVKARFADPEIFVRVTAVDTIAQIADGAESYLLEQFEKQHELKPAILENFLSKPQKTAPEKMWDLLQTAPPEVILQCLETFESRDDYEGKRSVHAARFANHPNKDVAAAARRILASHGRSTKYLLDALRSKDPAEVDAVLDALRLKPGFFGRLAAPAAPAGTGSNPTLDRLYTQMRAAAPAENRPATANVPVAAGEADPQEFANALRKHLREGSAHQRLRAALVLFPSGDAEARQHILSVFETLAPIDRRAVAGGLGGLQDWTPIKALAARVLQDPADDVRETAVDSWLKNPARLGEMLAEIAKPGSIVGPAEIYDWQLDRLLEQGSANAPVLEWGRATLADPQAKDAHKAFAIVLADRAGLARELPLESFTKAANPVLRRAAFRALGHGYVESHLDAVVNDDSALVRQVLPFLASPTNNTWQHFFDDASFADDHKDYQRHTSGPKFGAWAGSGGVGGPPSDPLLKALEKLARDPAESVRFEAMFCLLRLGKPVDPKTFATALASQPAERRARDRLGNFLETEYLRLGQGYGLLVPLADGVSPENHAKMVKHFKLERKSPPATFAALAKIDPAPIDSADNQIAPAAENKSPHANMGGPFRVLFFHKVGCRECERARQMLASQAGSFPDAKIEERDIDDPKHALLNEALSSRLKLKDTLHQVTPAIFTQTGALVKNEITFPAVGDLLRETQAAPRNDAWDKIEVKEIAAAEEQISERYDALSLGVVGMAGLLDGINPCAFATIIFLLSYLQVARRSPREILAVGAAFIGAVFLAYFVVGLGLVQIIGRLDGMRVVGNILNYALAAFALILALFSFRDAQLAARGQAAEMTLQLPASLKEQIRTAIRTSAKARRFVIGAFLAGIVISLLELACTGQVYLPTILYMVRSGRGGAMGHLLAYNLAFVLPLVIVFAMAWAGMRSDALLKFQQRHLVLVKVMTGVLFLALTAFLLFGHVVVPMMASSSR